MKYYAFHIDDSGAIEDIDYKIKNGENIPFCKMYDDEEFNNLNDILHYSDNYIINSNVLDIFNKSNLMSHKLTDAKVLRKEKKFGFLKLAKSYDYYELTLNDDETDEFYNCIDFQKSEVFAIDNEEIKRKITSHQETLDLIIENKSFYKRKKEMENSKLSPKQKESSLKEIKQYSFETKRIVFNYKFNFDIDLFKIPHYSWGVYVSDRLRNKLLNADITDIDFTENKERLGKMWKPYFPIIEFNSEK